MPHGTKTRMLRMAISKPRMSRQVFFSRKKSKKRKPRKKRVPKDMGELILISEIKENLNKIAQIKRRT